MDAVGYISRDLIRKSDAPHPGQHTMALCYVFSCSVEYNDCSMGVLLVKWLPLSTRAFNYRIYTHIAGNGSRLP